MPPTRLSPAPGVSPLLSPAPQGARRTPNVRQLRVTVFSTA